MKEKLMSKQEFLNSEIFAEYISRIEKMPKGYKWHVPYYKMKPAVKRAMDVLTQEATKRGLIKSISIGMGWNDEGDFVDTEETFEIQ